MIAGAVCGAIYGAIAQPLRAATLSVGEGDDRRRLSAKVGDTIEISLSENASTGFVWEVDRADKLSLIDKTSRKADRPMPGAAGTAIFRFAFTAAGSGALALKLWQPWVGEKSIVQRWAVTIDAVA